MPDQDKTTSQPLSKVCLKCQKSYAADLTACPDDGSKLETRENLIGLTLAKKYEIIGKLGEGGMAVVYKARHKVMQRDVAIKMLKKHLISDMVAYQRFEQESQAASSLNHPNIVTVFDFGNEDDHAYFVMDCVEGQTLSQRLEKVHWIAEEEALDIFAQLCEGLTHAHRKGVVHRDLKPSNVVLMPQDDGKVLVKIVDFGIAKLLPSAGKQIQKLTQAGEVFGSPLYMSPEQCLGKDLDPRSDIYSLGCLMYQALTGALPLMGDTAFETMNMHVGSVPPPFKQANPDVVISAETEAVVFKCLQKDPGHRYQSAAAILADLPIQGRLPLAITVREKALPAKRSAFDRNVAIFAVIFTVISGTIFFGWENPVADRGTPYHKLFWNMCLSMGERLVENNQDRMAIWWFERAKAHASQIADQHAKYISALSEEKSAYAGLGQQDMVDQIDDELAKIRRQSALEQKEYWMDVLKAAKQSTSTIDSHMKDALSKLSNVQQTAMQLFGYGYYRQEQELLELALSEGVYRKGLPKNDKQLAELNLLLGKCYQAQSLMDQAANSYQEASKIYENIQRGSADAIKSLLILGIFQKETSDWEKALPILGQALTEARQFKAKATAAATQATASTTATEREKAKAADNAELSSELAKQSTSAFVDLIKQLKLTKSPMVPEAEKFLKDNSR